MACTLRSRVRIPILIWFLSSPIRNARALEVPFACTFVHAFGILPPRFEAKRTSTRVLVRRAGSESTSGSACARDEFEPTVPLRSVEARRSSESCGRRLTTEEVRSARKERKELVLRFASEEGRHRISFLFALWFFRSRLASRGADVVVLFGIDPERKQRWNGTS